MFFIHLDNRIHLFFDHVFLLFQFHKPNNIINVYTVIKKIGIQNYGLKKTLEICMINCNAHLKKFVLLLQEGVYSHE